MVPLVVFVGLIMQKSLVLLKPDCVERRLVGEIIGRFERKGLNIIAMKMVRVSPELSKQHYAEHVSKPFYPNLEEFITSSPIVAMVIEGLDVVRVIREMLGDFSSSRQMNLVHASDSEESAVREVSLYFQASELCEYTPTLVGSFRAGDES